MVVIQSQIQVVVVVQTTEALQVFDFHIVETLLLLLFTKILALYVSEIEVGWAAMGRPRGLMVLLI